MTACERFDADLGAYHDGALEEAERVPVGAHLQSCERCQAALERIASLDSAIRALPRSQPSSDFAAQFQARLAQSAATLEQEHRPVDLAARRRAPGRRPWRSLGWAGAAGTLAAAAAALFLAVPPKTTTPVPPAAETAAKLDEPQVVATLTEDEAQTAANLTGEDWQIVADEEAFELLVNEDEDLDLLYALDALENWDDGQGQES